MFSIGEKKIAERLTQKGCFLELERGRISRVSASERFTDNDVWVLVYCGSLSYLDLQRSQITDYGMTYIGNIASLRGLHLGHTAVSAKGLAPLQNLTSLRSLDLTGTSIVIDDAVEYIEVLSSLRWLDLRLTPKTEASPSAIEHLRNKNPNLEFHPGGLPVVENP